MNASYFTHNCNKCQGLCCIATLRGGELFASNDAVGKACRHLQGNFKCAIHATLGKKGFPGCIPYTCYGVGNRLTRLLRIANIPDLRKPLTGNQKDIARVIQDIFKELEEIFSTLQSPHQSEKELFSVFHSKAEALLSDIENMIREGGNIYIAIPRVIELYAELRVEKRKIYEKQGAHLGLTAMARRDVEAVSALKWINSYTQADIPQKEFEKIMQEEGENILHAEQLRKFIFAAYQLGWSYYWNTLLWKGIDISEALAIANETSCLYAGYIDSEEGFHTLVILKLIFEKCSRTQFQPI